VVAKIQYLL